MMWRRETEPGPNERAEGVRDMAQEAEVTVVGQGAKLEGTIVSAGSLRIDGQVKGQINADGDVTLSPQSQVEADIRAQNVSVAGRFHGNIVVKDRAHLAKGGRIDGNITSKSLVIQEGGVFSGQSTMEGGTPPAQQPGTGQPTTASGSTAPNGSDARSGPEAARTTAR